MKQVIIAIAALTVSAGTAVLLISHSMKRTAHKPPMTFWELYEDNQCSDCGLFD